MCLIRRGENWRLAVPPSDRVLLALLTLALVVALVRWPTVGESLASLVAEQAVLLFGFGACVAGMARWERLRCVPMLRTLATVAVVFTLYSSLGRLGLLAVPYRLDGALSSMDSCIFGFDPSLTIQPYQTPGRVAFFSFVYGAFIPYIYLSLLLGCLGRPPLERDQFLTGWVFAYSISYLGYLFLPAQGPVIFQADQFTTTLEGGVLHQMVVRGIDSVGGPKGAFPSLHVGASVYLCLFDLKTNRLRGLTYLPIVLLIYVATVFLRYHYVVDLVAGTAIGVSCVALGKRAFLTWAQARVDAGLPALTGGEEDDLPSF